NARWDLVGADRLMPGAYWPRPWTCEDGGPLRRCCADGVPGLGIQPGESLEVAASDDAFATDLLVRREPGELYALRHDMPLRRPPVARPHNSFVVRDGGELVTKDCDAPAGLAPSTVSVLDPQTLLPVAPALRLPEPSIARLASDGESVIAVGTTVVFRLRLDRA